MLSQAIFKITRKWCDQQRRSIICLLNPDRGMRSAQAPSFLDARSLAAETAAGSHRFYGGVPLTLDLGVLLIWIPKHAFNPFWVY